MSQQVHKEVSRHQEMDELADEDIKAGGEKPDRVTVEDIDELLDEIDGVLETNAEEFVRHYVQRGGQAAVVFLNTVARGFGAIAWRSPWAV